MRAVALIAAVAVVGAASPLLAQERLNPDPRGFISGFGGTTRALGSSTRAVQVEGGVRIAPHIMIFGNLGHCVASAIESAGIFTQPAASTSSMFTTGAGAQVPFGPHWTFDAGYRF
jgi:opacity protein-like surface antigen